MIMGGLDIEVDNLIITNFDEDCYNGLSLTKGKKNS